MDSSLSWKQHVEVVVSRLSSFSFALRELRKRTDVECALAAKQTVGSLTTIGE